MPICRRKIDIHAHAVREDVYPAKQAFLPADKLLSMYDSRGVEQGLLFPIFSPESRRFPTTTEDMMAVAAQHPDRFLFGIGLDPRMVSNSQDADFSQLLAWYKSKGAKAVGELVANIPFDDPLYDNMLAQCAEQDLPVTIHISPKVGYGYGVVDEPGLPRLERVLKKHPTLKILGHSQAFWAHISTCDDPETMKIYPKGKVVPGRLIQLMDIYGNLYCDLSAGSGFNALSRDPEFAFRFLDTYQDRILFGQDLCREHDKAPLSAWLDDMYLAGNISEEAYWKICRENAVRLLKL